MGIGRTSVLCCKVGFLIVITSYVRLTMCQNSGNRSETARLIQEKLGVYNKQLRPIQNLSRAIDVKVAFDLLSIKEFNEVLETISVVGFLRLYWIDEFVTWDPSEYAGREDLLLSVGDIWTPDLVLLNPVDEIKKVESPWSKVRINFTGDAKYTPGAVFSAICKMDTTFYPWDIQTCSFLFHIWSYTHMEVQLNLLQTEVMQTFYTENGEWEMVGSSSEYGFDRRLITFKIHLKRRSQFVLVNMILPIVFMSFLNVLAFPIPVDSGERLSYCITVLLAQAVFLTIVGDNLPKTSDPMSILSYYLLAVLTISVSITVSVILSISVYFRDEKHPVPRCLSKFARVLSAGVNNIHQPSDYNIGELGVNSVCLDEKECRRRVAAHSDLHSQNAKDTFDSDSSYTHVIGNSKNTALQKNDNNSSVKYIDDTYDYCCSARAREYLINWKDVSIGMDRVLFVVFLLSTVGCMLWAMVRMIGNK